jgi:hypothetical protein
MQGKLVSIRKTTGLAGQIQFDAVVAYVEDDGVAALNTTSFVGSVYGGPVVMIGSTGTQTFVADPDRFGKFGEVWVRRFFE